MPQNHSAVICLFFLFICHCQGWYSTRGNTVNSSVVSSGIGRDKVKHTLIIHFMRNASTLANSSNYPCNSSTMHEAMQMQVKAFS